ncbi:YceD family protein [Piscinibacter sp.]|uniref:YceD family protein n=1 Tax=Piscinibacter sp. TaxID=1903157 RepID=UPI0039E67B93
MKPRVHDPLRLDVEVFAKDAGRLEGRWPLAGFARLAESAHAQARPGAADPVAWQARGEQRAQRGGAAQTWLHVEAEAEVQLECQRCLQAVAVPLAVRRSFLFAPDEPTAAAIDADSEDDVLVLTRALDLHELVEDELILALPLVPRHDVCAQPLAVPAPAEEAQAERPHPFAALAALKRGAGGSH